MKTRLSLLLITSLISTAFLVGCSDGSDKRTKAVNNRMVNDLAAAKKAHDDGESRADEIEMLVKDTPVEKMSAEQLRDLHERVRNAHLAYKNAEKRYNSVLMDDAREKKITLQNHGEVVKNRKRVVEEIRALEALAREIKATLRQDRAS